MQTALYSSHQTLGSKFADFAGYDMPLYYPTGALEEHLWVRQQAGLFDVSHMGQVMMEGEEVVAALEHLTPAKISAMHNGQAKYTVLLNDDGHILDDLIVTRFGKERFMLVINASRVSEDLAWIKQHCLAGVNVTHLADRALISIQGPQAEAVLQAECGDLVDLKNLHYMHATTMHAQGEEIWISRVGYTGEDGFEISVENAHALAWWNALLEHESSKPIGLAARDSLRLEMGYLLNGQDMDDSTSPLEVNLNWVLRKQGDYIGRAALEHFRQQPLAKKQVAFQLEKKAIARCGDKIYAGDREVGLVTSGGFSPSLQCGIGLAMIDNHLDDVSILEVQSRKRRHSLVISALPLVTTNVKKAL